MPGLWRPRPRSTACWMWLRPPLAMPRARMWPPIRPRPAATPASDTRLASTKGFVMSQIMYNYPAMLAHAADMAGYAGALSAVGADVASEQAALSGAWQGDTGMTYQAWQAQWNTSMEEL